MTHSRFDTLDDTRAALLILAEAGSKHALKLHNYQLLGLTPEQLQETVACQLVLFAAGERLMLQDVPTFREELRATSSLIVDCMTKYRQLGGVVMERLPSTVELLVTLEES